MGCRSSAPAVDESSKLKRGQSQPIRQKDLTHHHGTEDDPFTRPVDLVRKEQDELRVLSRMTHFSTRTIEKLYVIFEAISESRIKDGIVDIEEFALAIGLSAESVLTSAMFRSFDQSKTQGLNFREFVITLSTLSSDASLKEKAKFSFELWDLNGDGKIDIHELFLLSREALRHADSSITLTDEDIHTLCESTLKEFGVYEDSATGHIDYEQFLVMVEKQPRILDPFTVDIERMLQQTPMLTAKTLHDTDVKAKVTKMRSAKMELPRSRNTFTNKDDLQPIVIDDHNIDMLLHSFSASPKKPKPTKARSLNSLFETAKTVNKRGRSSLHYEQQPASAQVFD